ncbi:MAG: lipoyl(octanoyl) transferase LipB [Muribaculaceae bacterium]|nr:lipoyl(octanoyl) transferase LipB [Muribaculaceae bacterium]
MRVRYCGLIPYREAWNLQKEIVAGLQASDSSQSEEILLVEHPHVYTLGFHGNADNLLADVTRLEAIGAECIRIERGGDITYHGPGQLVVYPLLSLRDHKLGVKQYIEILEHSVIELLQAYGIDASCNNEAIGVWIEWGTPRARKICAIGVKVSHGVTMHGLALNVNTDLSKFMLINPCGITDKSVTSMSVELGRSLNFRQIADNLASILLRKLS